MTQLLHKEEIVVKPLGAFLEGVGPYGGATVSADGRVTLLLDPVRLGELAMAGAPAAGARRERAAARADLGGHGPGAGHAAARKGSVLLVDDSISVRRFVGQMLEKAGFDVTTASDGADAVTRLGERSFDVMVTDLEMPRLNGYELLEDVRRRPGMRELPIVILTTRSGAKHQSPRPPARRQPLRDQAGRRGRVREAHRIPGAARRRGGEVMKVLVVDPDLRRAPALKDTLAAGGAEVTIASSGSFALTMLEWNRHDVVVSRARIDDMDGHELCAILKADPGTREVRFVLVAGADEVTGAETAAAGVDLVLPPSMTSGAILPLVVRLMQANRAAGSEAPSMSAPAPAPAAAIAPVAAPIVLRSCPRLHRRPFRSRGRPRRRGRGRGAAHQAGGGAAAARRSTEALRDHGDGGTRRPLGDRSIRSRAGRAAAEDRRRPLCHPGWRHRPRALGAAHARGGADGPALGAVSGARRRSGFHAWRQPGAAVHRRPPVVPQPRLPGVRPAPASPRAAAPPPARPAATPSVPDLASIPSGTFQGSLEVMELADLTQAISAGGKTGRLILALPQGGGLMLYDKGRIVHAEYRNAVGEEAFGALLAACHADGAGRFCFLPSPAGESTGQPRTIDKTVDQLLLSSATAIDEKG